MPQVNLTADLVASQSSVTVTAAPGAGGQLLVVDAAAYDVTVCLPVSPVRLKWRIGTSGAWSDIEGGECFTVAGPDAANVYLAKAAAQSASVVVTVTVQTVGAFMAGRADARAVTYSESINGWVRKFVNGYPVIEHDPTGWPMALPYTLSSPPTFTNGVANAASAISGGIKHKIFDKSRFTVLGGSVVRGTNFPNYMGAQLGVYPQITSTSPVAIEFSLDTADATGRFEIDVKGNGGKYRVLVKQRDGWGAITSGVTRSLPNDGNGYLDLVTLGAAGTYQIRIETYGVIFYSIRTAATDSLGPTKQRRLKYLVVGDSFTEPTITDSGGSFEHSGWVPLLSHLTGYDLWCAGSGGTGYLKPNAVSGRPKFYDRLLTDILSQQMDGVIFAGGINDDGSYTAEEIKAEALRCFRLVRQYGLDLIVLSPFWPRGVEGFSNTILQTSDAIAEAAKQVSAPFLDLLQLGGFPDYLRAVKDWSSTVSSAYSSGTNLVLSDVPGYFKGAGVGLDGWYIRIGDENVQYVRPVSNISGSGPYTVAIGSALPASVAAGTKVRLGQSAYITGLGRQGSPSGSGSADRLMGADDHPTVAGHGHIAKCVADAWARSVSGK